MNITAQQLKEMGYVETKPGMFHKDNELVVRSIAEPTVSVKPPSPHKPLLNKTEARWKAVMVSRGITGIMEQAITLRLDPPFKSYRADFAYLFGGLVLCLVEVKGPHRFREKGIAKAALAAKCYPGFKFELVEWDGHQWKESVL